MASNNDSAVVLVADDDGVTRAMVSRWLSGAGYEVVAAADGEEALARARTCEPDLLLVDVTMPGRDGYEVCRAIQAESTAPPPVIFLTAHGQTDARVAGLDAGAVDYIVKPFVSDELLARVRAALRTKADRDLLAERASRDVLTGLCNRRELDTQAERAVALAQRHGRPLTCLMVDLDHFKSVNDTYGHAAGDAVLREAAHRIRVSLRISDIVGRYGGEEFVILCPETEVHTAAVVADKLRARIAAAPVVTGDVEISLHASIGVAVLGEEMSTVAELYAAADQALYRAKELGRDRTEVFSAPAHRTG